MTPDEYRRAIHELADRVRGAVAEHDVNVRAAVELACSTILLPKIAAYVDADGWIDFDRLADDLADGVPWSGGEKRLARLACSLAGFLPTGADEAWALGSMLYGLDDRNAWAAARAVTYAFTGQPPAHHSTARPAGALTGGGA